MSSQAKPARTRTGLPRVMLISVSAALAALACVAEEPEDAYVYADALTSLDPLPEARYSHTATTLPDGRVLVLGGTLGSPGTLDIDAYVAEVDLWDPMTRSFERGAALAVPRTDHTATRLADGRVVVVGGTTDMGLPSPAYAVEVWDPDTASFETVAELELNLIGHCAVATANDDVVVLDDCDAADCKALRINPGTGAVTALAGLSSHSYDLDLDCVPLADGRVFLAGGTRDEMGAAVPVNEAEIYDPDAGSFSIVGPMSASFGPGTHVVPLSSGEGSGELLIVGDADPSSGVLGQVYSPASGEWREVQGSGQNRIEHLATPLADGRVLISGGRIVGSPNLAYAEGLDVFDPASDTITPLGLDYAPRTGHAAAALLDGPVLLLGGQDQAGRLVAADLFE